MLNLSSSEEKPDSASIYRHQKLNTVCAAVVKPTDLQMLFVIRVLKVEWWLMKFVEEKVFLIFPHP